MDGIGYYEFLRERDAQIHATQRRRLSPVALARVFPHKHQQPAPVSPATKLIPAADIPQKAAKPVRISEEMKAEIAALAFQAVDKRIAQLRRDILLAAAPIQPSERPTATEVIQIVAVHAELQLEDFMSPRREHRLAWPRQIAMTLIKEAIPMLSYPQIGRVFGGKDHTTVIHAVRRTAKYIADDGAMAQLYRRARGTIEAKWPAAFG